jgi:hypothetical protein
MTKHEFCKQIVQTVDNCREIDGMTDDEIATAIEGLISTLAPKDMKRFAAWGYPAQVSTVDKCW